MPNADVVVTVQGSDVVTLLSNLQKANQLKQQLNGPINITINTGQIDSATRSLTNMSSQLQNISTIMRGMASLSGAVGNFASGIGNSFSSMSSLFGNRNVSTALTRFLTYNALRGVTGNLSNIVSRYDIMSTFIPYMAIAGVDSTSARASLDRVNESILGLPIGLDEAAQRLRRYQMFMNDIEGATDLTIGVQNAILAGGASASMQNMAYMQIDRLLSAGKLNQSRQWLSLIQGLGVSMRFISEQMGTTGMSARELAAGLTSGKISTEQFLNALKELGRGDSDAAQGLMATLGIYKGTIEAWVNNINFAFARGGENVLKALNASLVEISGQGVTGYMKNYRDFLNEAFLGAADWIDNNPQALTTVIGEGAHLLETLQRFSASGFAESATENIGRLFSMISTGLSTIPEGRLESFAGFATTLAGPLGKIMGMSSGLGQLVGVFERFERFDFDMLIGDMSDQIGNMANAVSSLLGVLDDEAMSKLLSIGLVWGQPVASALNTGASALTTAAMMKIAFGNLSLGPILAGLGGIGLGVAGGAGLAYALNNADQQNMVNYLSQHGLLNIMGDDRYAPVQSVLSSARQSYYTATYTPVETTERAIVAQNTLKTNLAALGREYQTNAQYLIALENAKSVMSDRYDELTAKAQTQAGLTKEEAKEYSDLLVSIDPVNKKIAETKEYMELLNGEMVTQGTTVGELVIRFGDLGDSVEDVEEVVRTIPEELSEAQKALNTVYESLSKTVDKTYAKQVGGLKAMEYDKPKSGSYVQDYINVLTGNTKKGTTINESIKSISDYINAHHGEDGVDSIGGMVRRLLGEGDLEKAGPIINEFAELLESGNLTKAQELLQAYTDNLYAQGEGQQEAVAMLQEAEQGLIEYAEGLGSIDFAVFDPSEGGRNWNGIFNIVQAQAAQADNAKEQLQESVNFVAESLGLVSDSVGEGLGNAQENAESGGEAIVDTISEIPGEIESQAGDFQAATEALGPPMETGLNNTVNNIQSGTNNVLAAIEQAKAQIQAAAGAISINIPVNITTTTSGAVSLTGAPSIAVSEAIESGGRATGGPIWKPFGSDTVPMMLTPGEYVIRKGAADFFGRGLLERINALDIGGAFDRLILNSPVTAGRYGGNVYNKDSHASVTQNYYNSSPDYGRRRAMRFAHAL